MKTSSTNFHCSFEHKYKKKLGSSWVSFILYLFLPVPPHELVVKVDTDLRDGVVASKDESIDDVVATITAGLKTRNL